jgi:hypothetical protein
MGIIANKYLQLVRSSIKEKMRPSEFVKMASNPKTAAKIEHVRFVMPKAGDRHYGYFYVKRLTNY